MEFKEIIAEINRGNPLDFGSIFSKSLELSKQVWVLGLVMVLSTFITKIPFYVLMYIPMLAKIPVNYMYKDNIGFSLET